MNKIICNGAEARCLIHEMLTSGMVGVMLEIEYSEEFDGLTKTAVFSNGTEQIDVVDVGTVVEIPWEVLATPKRAVTVGIYAMRGTELIIPTISTIIGVVHQGVDPSGDPSVDPTLPVWGQIQSKIGSLDNLETEAKENLVNAINEAYNHGGGGEAILAMRVYEGYIQYTTDNQTWVNLIAVADLKGDKGDTGATGAKGDKGEQGEQGIQGIQGEQGAKGDKGDTGAQGLQGIQGIQGEKGDKGDTGEKGADGADGVDGQDGYTPVRGTDYWTAADKAEIVDDVLDEIPEIDLSDYALKTDLTQLQKKVTRATVTLAAASWSNKAQTVTVQGILADETAQLIQPVPASASMAAYYDAGILATGQAANSLTFSCEEVPTADLTVYIVITEVSANA